MGRTMRPLEHSPGDTGATGARALYDRIGAFLHDQRIEPNPANFALAYAIVTDPGSTLAAEVAMLTDGGVRLSQRDFDSLGVRVDPASAEGKANELNDAQVLAARAQSQMDDFSDVVVRMQAHALDFGRDLLASADAIERSRSAQGASAVFVNDVARITAGMISRVREAERRLEEAHREAEELREALEAARGDALSDPLTGLPNRRAFEQAYAMRQMKGGSCVAICDVDHFKLVNDRFGHTVGDRVLRAIGKALSCACEGHFVARYGGEEFAILYDGELSSAIETIDQARRDVGRRRFRVRESDEVIGTITFSTGVSLGAAAEPLAVVFERADNLLYAAKAAGRDTIFADGDLSV